MPPELIPSDEEYASSEDEDFAPDVAVAREDSSESEDEADDAATIINNKKKASKRKRGSDEEAEDAGFENSGDEAIIEKGLKKRKRKSKKGGKGEDDVDEGGEGGLIKTRSMRAQEKVEKKPLADTKAATVDVDALWAQMVSNQAPSNPTPQADTTPKSPERLRVNGSQSPELHRASRERSNFSEGADSMIMIKRTYNFAGKVHTEQKLVARDSAEAKLFLESQAKDATPDVSKEPELFVKPKRPTKKARRSIFEPVTELTGPLRTDLVFGARRMEAGGALAATKDAKKLNTVEKSAMDWAGFVDKEGIKDELNAAGKKKGAFKERVEFLARVERKKEEEERRARGLPV